MMGRAMAMGLIFPSAALPLPRRFGRCANITPDLDPGSALRLSFERGQVKLRADIPIQAGTGRHAALAFGAEIFVANQPALEKRPVDSDLEDRVGREERISTVRPVAR